MDQGQTRVVACAVEGRVVDGRGMPRPGVWVYAHPFKGARFGDAVGVHSGADGQWTLTLAPGRWQLRQPGTDPYEVTVTAEAAPPPPATGVVSSSSIERLEARRAGLPIEDTGTSTPAPPPEPEPTAALDSWSPSAAVAARRAAYARRQEQ